MVLFLSMYVILIGLYHHLLVNLTWISQPHNWYSCLSGQASGRNFAPSPSTEGQWFDPQLGQVKD